MKILHTADWHLGKSLNQFPLLEDQAEALAQLVAVAAAEQPDVILLAGDIYDRAVPPAEAIALFNRTVSHLVLELKIPLLAIAGNHDNAERIHYGAQLFEKQGFHISGYFTFPMQPIVLPDQHGPVYFYLFPYTEPEMLRAALRGCLPEAEREAIKTHDDVLRWVVAHLRAQRQPGDRIVLVAHAFVQGGTPSDSERKLLVGGAEFVGIDAFAGLSYTALGHLHQPQAFNAGSVSYAGSPFKYSISEASHRKTFALVELDEHGLASTRQIPFVPKRDLWVVSGEIIEGNLRLSEGQAFAKPDDYLHVKLQNPEVQANAMALIQRSHPNAIGLEWANLADRGTARAMSAEKMRQMSEEELVAQFYEDLMGKALDPAKREIIHQIITKIQTA